MDNTEEKIKELVDKIRLAEDNIEAILTYFKEIVSLDEEEKYVNSYTEIFEEIFEQLPKSSDKKIELWNLANYNLQLNKEDMLMEVLYIARKNPEKYIDILYGTKAGRYTMLENTTVVNRILEHTFEEIQDEEQKMDIVNGIFAYGERIVRGTETTLLRKSFKVLQKMDNPVGILTTYGYVQNDRKTEIEEVIDKDLINEKIKKYIKDRVDAFDLIEIYNEMEKTGIQGLEKEAFKLQIEEKLKENPIETLKTLNEYSHLDFKNFGNTVIEILSELQEKGEDVSEYKFDITLSLTQLKNLLKNMESKKLSKDIKFNVYVENIKDFSSEDFGDIKESIEHVKFKKYNYSFEEFVACKNIIEKEILEGINLGSQDDPNREKKIFKQVIKNLAKKIKYDYVTIRKEDKIKKLKKDLINPKVTDKKKDEIKEKLESLRTQVKKAGVRNMIGPLIREKAVCAGYAHINAIVFECLGIEVKEIVGFPEKDEVGHAWNQIKLDGEWYNFDLTWERDNICMGKNPMFILKSDNEFEDHDKYIRTPKSKPEKCETSVLKQRFNMKNIEGFKGTNLIVEKSEKIKSWIKRAARTVSLTDIDRITKNIQKQVNKEREIDSKEDR